MNANDRAFDAEQRQLRQTELERDHLRVAEAIRWINNERPILVKASMGYVANALERILTARPSASLADTEQAEVETMRWNGSSRWSNSRGVGSTEIVAWVVREGGEAKYEAETPRCGQQIRGLYGAETICQRPTGHELPHTTNDGIWRPMPRIAVRTSTGWDYAAPGDEVVKGGKTLLGVPVSEASVGPDVFREFTVRRAADTDGVET